MDVSGQETDWRSAGFRQKLVIQIEEAMIKAGEAHSNSSKDMEGHVFQKARSRDEYLSLVARIIIHFRDIYNHKHQASVGDPVNALQNLTGVAPAGALGLGMAVCPQGTIMYVMTGLGQMAQQTSLPGLQQQQPGTSVMAPHGMAGVSAPTSRVVAAGSRHVAPAQEEEHGARPLGADGAIAAEAAPAGEVQLLLEDPTGICSSSSSSSPALSQPFLHSPFISGLAASPTHSDHSQPTHSPAFSSIVEDDDAGPSANLLAAVDTAVAESSATSPSSVDGKADLPPHHPASHDHPQPAVPFCTEGDHVTQGPVLHSIRAMQLTLDSQRIALIELRNAVVEQGREPVAQNEATRRLMVAQHEETRRLLVSLCGGTSNAPPSAPLLPSALPFIIPAPSTPPQTHSVGTQYSTPPSSPSSSLNRM